MSIVLPDFRIQCLHEQWHALPIFFPCLPKQLDHPIYADFYVLHTRVLVHIIEL